MGSFCVNLSNQTIPVWKDITFSEVIGHIRPRDIYVYEEYWNGNHVAQTDNTRVTYFPGNGTAVEGWIGNLPTNTATPLKSCALYQTAIDPDGAVQSVFTTKRAVVVYNPDGTYSTALPRLCYLASSTCLAGETNKDYMFVEYAGVHEPMPCQWFVKLDLLYNPSVDDFPLDVNI